MKIIMGADPAGFELKNAIKEDLLKRGYEIMDIDPDEPVLFQEAAKAVARGVQSKEYERGIAICGTGMGVASSAISTEVFMQHYAKAFIRPEGQKLSITPMYSAWVDLSLVMKWGVKWHAHGWKPSIW